VPRRELDVVARRAQVGEQIRADVPEQLVQRLAGLDALSLGEAPQQRSSERAL